MFSNSFSLVAPSSNEFFLARVVRCRLTKIPLAINQTEIILLESLAWPAFQTHLEVDFLDT